VKDRRTAIGVFDSGIGGLTVARELMRQLPGERLVYLGDTARTPYGNKSPENLVRFALETAGFLSKKGVKLLVVACNTSSAYSLPALRRKLKIPVVGVILAGARAAVGLRHGQRIGVIGTSATVRSGAYQKAIHALEPSAKVLAQACPLFVPLVEEGWSTDRVASQVAERYLRPLKRQAVDTVVLGCTHYPLLKTVLRRALGPKIALVDSARETAHEVAELLQATGLASGREKTPFAEHQFYVTDLPEQFSALGTRFLGQRLRRVQRVSLAQLAKASL
jgi:glutamate racemase